MTVLRRIGLFAVAVAVLIFLLVWSLPTMIPLGLALAGVDDVTFDSIDVGFRSTRIDALTIGDPQRQSVATIEARYSLGRLVSGRVDQIRIDGLAVHAAYDDVLDFGDAIKSDDTEGGQSDDGPFELASLLTADDLLIENSRIDIETSMGPLSLPFDGRASVVDDQLQFDLEVSSANLTATDLGTFQAQLELGGYLPLTGAPRADRLVAKGRFDLQAADMDLFDDGRPVVVKSAIDLNLADGLLTLAGPLAITGQIGSAEGEFSGVFELDEHLRPTAIAASEVVLGLTEIHLDDVELDRGRATLQVDGLLDDLMGTLTLDLDGLTTSLGTVELHDIKIQRVLDVTLADRMLDVIARTDGEKASVDQISVTDGDKPVMESGWFTLQWPSREDPWLRLDLDDRSVALDWQLEIDPVRIDFAARRSWARIEDLAVTLDGGLHGLESSAIHIRRGRIDLPSANLTLAGIESDFSLSDLGLSTDGQVPLTIRSVRPLDEPRLFAPLRLDAHIWPEASTFDVEGTLTTTSGPKAVLAFDGRHDIEVGQGALDVDLAPLTFSAAQLQPGDLSPILDGVIDDAEGEVALNGRIAWQGGQLVSDIALLIDELGFAIGPARLSRINSVIRFDGMAPMTTPQDQLLSIGLLDVGLPLTDGLVSMRLQPDGRLAVDRLTWRLADGRIRAAPFTFGSDVQDLTLMLKAEQLDLDELLRLTPLDELTGEGRIDGTLPLTIGEAAAIRGGELAATGKGVLRYKPSTVPGVLQAGGESVRLMLQALENFRYDALKITLDGRTDGANAIGLHLKGANPDLYDGHPVEFNLNLEGNLASLIQTNIDNYQIPDRIRERIQGFER